MPKFSLSPFAVAELTQIEETIAADSPQAALRFIDAAYETFGHLASTPLMGRARTFKNSKLADLRSFRVSGFDKYLIFYQPIHGGVRVHHVFHGARDLENLLGE